MGVMDGTSEWETVRVSDVKVGDEVRAGRVKYADRYTYSARIQLTIENVERAIVLNVTDVIERLKRIPVPPPEQWETVTFADVRVGDVVRSGADHCMTVAVVERGELIRLRSRLGMEWRDIPAMPLSRLLPPAPPPPCAPPWPERPVEHVREGVPYELSEGDMVVWNWQGVVAWKVAGFRPLMSTSGDIWIQRAVPYVAPPPRNVTSGALPSAYNSADAAAAAERARDRRLDTQDGVAERAVAIAQIRMRSLRSERTLFARPELDAAIAALDTLARRLARGPDRAPGTCAEGTCSHTPCVLQREDERRREHERRSCGVGR